MRQFDPATESWSVTGSAFYERTGHTATLLPNGRVLVTGGNNTTLSSELYDPAVAHWYTTGPRQITKSRSQSTDPA